MTKTRGGNHMLRTHSKEWERRLAMTDAMKNNGRYSEVVFDYASGGYFAVETSTQRHSKDELEVASILAHKGYPVTLVDEGGRAVVVDGRIFSATYEQRTPSLSEDHKRGLLWFDPSKNFKSALKHAMTKGADIALVYMKNHLHTRASVAQGLKEFEKYYNYRFKIIIVVTADGRVHRHVHNDK